MLVVLALATTLAAGCGGTDNEAAGSGVGGTLTIGLSGDFSSLNPAVDSGLSTGGFALYFPYATLVAKNPGDGSYGPGLAESFGYVGTGNKTYELKLRQDVKFADGTPLDAEAVKQWFTYFPTAPGGTLGAQLAIESIETPDNLTVRINLKTPTPLVTDLLTGGWGMVVSPKALSDPKQLSAGAPGAGPYVYDQSQTVTGKGATYTLVPNTYYYDKGQVKWSKIVLKVIDDPATMLRSMQSGQLDVAMGSLSTFSAAKSAGLNVSTAAGGFAEVYFLDSDGTKAKALGDVRVRQALNYAINRESIVKSLFGGAVEATSEPVLTDASDPALQNYYPYDPAKAKQLLAEAGYPNGFTFSMVAPTFGTLVGTPLVQAVAQNWADIGVKVNVVAPATQTELYQKFLTESAWLLEYTAVPTVTLASRFMPDAAVNPYKVAFPEMVDLSTRAQSAPQDEQKQLALDMVKQWVTAAYSAPIATKSQILYSTKKVSGAEAKPWMLTSPVVVTWTASS